MKLFFGVRSRNISKCENRVQIFSSPEGLVTKEEKIHDGTKKRGFFGILFELLLLSFHHRVSSSLSYCSLLVFPHQKISANFSSL